MYDCYYSTVLQIHNKMNNKLQYLASIYIVNHLSEDVGLVLWKADSGMG